jgi:hypothetical protein
LYLPAGYGLLGNHPNPFNSSTTIRFALPRDSEVTLTVYNVPVQRVATLLEGRMEAGYHDGRFEARDLSSGVYLSRLRAGGTVQTRSLLLLW